jgi:putative NADH-flavin reductase
MQRGANAVRLSVLGATGGTGQQIIAQAVEAGHHVVAVARRPQAVGAPGPRLTIVSGDVLDPAWRGSGIEGADAVLSALGARTGRAPTNLYSASTAAVLDAMTAHGARRLVCVSATPVGPADQQAWLDRRVAHPILSRLFGGLYADMRRMEEVLAASDADWTVFRPPRLTDGPATGRYRTAVGTQLARAWTLARADLAAAMLAAVTDSSLIGKAVTIAR